MSKETRSSSPGIDLKALRIQRILDGESKDARLISSLRAQLDAANTKLKAKEDEVREKDRKILDLNDALKAGATDVETNGKPIKDAERERRRQCRVLGLDPSFSKGLSDATRDEIIKSAYRTYSRLFAVDKGGNLEHHKRINGAKDYFFPKPQQSRR